MQIGKLGYVLTAAALPFMMGASGARCQSQGNTGGLKAEDFVLVSENGFDASQQADRQNDYPWAMCEFTPDSGPGAGIKHLYTGTGNGIDDAAFYELGLSNAPERPTYPAQIRRYRPDLGAKNWEVVFDFSDVDSGPPWPTAGVRAMAVYRPGATTKVPAPSYLYAGTFGRKPALWRTADGTTWEKVWQTKESNSIRGLVVHNGLLYFSLADAGLGVDFRSNDGPAKIFATDGNTVWTVVDDGFGNPNNQAVWSLASFNGWLYAGTFNPVTGFEVWKLEPAIKTLAPIQIVSGGATDKRNTVAGTSIVFNDQLYFGSLTISRANEGTGTSETFKNPDIIRINADDSWDTVVGKNSVGGVKSGFGKIENSYIWSFGVYDGWLYAGTWGFGTDILITIDRLPEFLQYLPAFIQQHAKAADGSKRNATQLTNALKIGADLYKTQDGVTWYPVFTNGLGDPYNYGLRNIIPTDDGLFLGMANPYDGLEIWKSTTPQ